MLCTKCFISSNFARGLLVQDRVLDHFVGVLLHDELVLLAGGELIPLCRRRTQVQGQVLVGGGGGSV